ncbi:MAG: type II toxin-antitoxin system VapC family toxin [Acidobacteriota bacterium]|jgi:predicted nucleic acid-binding protein|nr:type II toxin-antitoxin system VapC family toxin [Acidobacteriota bacterium]
MIVLDTNVLSEVSKSEPEEKVIAWLDAQDVPTLCTTTITQAEIFLGIALMPDGKRKKHLAVRYEELFSKHVFGRLFPFDAAAAKMYAGICAARRTSGKPISVIDAQIAAICLARGAILATRNTKDFAGVGLECVNPWEYAP